MTEAEGLIHALQRAGTGGLTTLDLFEATGSLNPSRRLSELRRAGHPISEAEYEGRTERGKAVHRYRWLVPRGMQLSMNLSLTQEAQT